MTQEDLNCTNKVYYYEDGHPFCFIRKRERKIGNTVYTVISRQSEDAKETALSITKRLIERNAQEAIDQPQTTESLEGCNSGGNKQ